MEVRTAQYQNRLSAMSSGGMTDHGAIGEAPAKSRRQETDSWRPWRAEEKPPPASVSCDPEQQGLFMPYELSGRWVLGEEKEVLVEAKDRQRPSWPDWVSSERLAASATANTDISRRTSRQDEQAILQQLRRISLSDAYVVMGDDLINSSCGSFDVNVDDDSHSGDVGATEAPNKDARCSSLRKNSSSVMSSTGSSNGEQVEDVAEGASPQITGTAAKSSSGNRSTSVIMNFGSTAGHKSKKGSTPEIDRKDSCSADSLRSVTFSSLSSMEQDESEDGEADFVNSPYLSSDDSESNPSERQHYLANNFKGEDVGAFSVSDKQSSGHVKALSQGHVEVVEATLRKLDRSESNEFDDMLQMSGIGVMDIEALATEDAPPEQVRMPAILVDEKRASIPNDSEKEAKVRNSEIPRCSSPVGTGESVSAGGNGSASEANKGDDRPRNSTPFLNDSKVPHQKKDGAIASHEDAATESGPVFLERAPSVSTIRNRAVMLLDAAERSLSWRRAGEIETGGTESPERTPSSATPSKIGARVKPESGAGAGDRAAAVPDAAAEPLRQRSAPHALVPRGSPSIPRPAGLTQRFPTHGSTRRLVARVFRREEVELDLMNIHLEIDQAKLDGRLAVRSRKAVWADVERLTDEHTELVRRRASLKEYRDRVAAERESLEKLAECLLEENRELASRSEGMRKERDAAQRWRRRRWKEEKEEEGKETGDARGGEASQSPGGRSAKGFVQSMRGSIWGRAA